MPFKIRQPGTHTFYTDAGEDFEFDSVADAEKFIAMGGLADADEPLVGYEVVETDLEGYEKNE
ncbi:MAG TPA: hypothetical protein VGM37_14205 [Armatimonadota bacterium]|jgi:hypothetical protein